MELLGWAANGPADLALGIVVFLVSLAVFLHPAPTFWRIWRMGTVGSPSPYPYMAVLFHCFILVMFSVARRSDVSDFKYACLLYLSQFGFAMMSFYIVIFFKFNVHRRRHVDCSIASLYVSIIVFIMIPAPIRNSLIANGRYLGQMAMITGIIMYMSPLYLIVRAYRKKHVECLPFWLCINFGLFGLAWTAYACLTPSYELCFSLSNGIGTILSVFQLGASYVVFLKIQNIVPIDSADVDLENSRTFVGDGLVTPLLN